MTTTIQTEALLAALGQRGIEYVYGGETPEEGFDCSGLTKWSYGTAGVLLPHSSALQYQQFPKVSTPIPGDIVFMLGSEPGTKQAPGHCGIVYSPPNAAGIGTFVQAEETGTVVMVSNFSIHDSQFVGYTRPGYSPPPWPGIYLRYPPLVHTAECAAWQSRMNLVAPADADNLMVDGDYGPISLAACKSYQLGHALIPDGVVGPRTWGSVFAAT